MTRSYLSSQARDHGRTPLTSDHEALPYRGRTSPTARTGHSHSQTPIRRALSTLHSAVRTARYRLPLRTLRRAGRRRLARSPIIYLTHLTEAARLTRFCVRPRSHEQVWQAARLKSGLLWPHWLDGSPESSDLPHRCPLPRHVVASHVRWAVHARLRVDGPRLSWAANTRAHNPCARPSSGRTYVTLHVNHARPSRRAGCAAPARPCKYVS